MRSKLAWLSGLVLVLTLAGCGLFMDEEALLQRAREARAKGDLRAAVIDLKDLLQRNPNSVPGRDRKSVV